MNLVTAELVTQHLGPYVFKGKSRKTCTNEALARQMDNAQPIRSKHCQQYV